MVERFEVLRSCHVNWGDAQSVYVCSLVAYSEHVGSVCDNASTDSVDIVPMYASAQAGSKTIVVSGIYLQLGAILDDLTFDTRANLRSNLMLWIHWRTRRLSDFKDSRRISSPLAVSYDPWARRTSSRCGTWPIVADGGNGDMDVRLLPANNSCRMVFDEAVGFVMTKFDGKFLFFLECRLEERVFGIVQNLLCSEFQRFNVIKRRRKQMIFVQRFLTVRPPPP